MYTEVEMLTVRFLQDHEELSSPVQMKIDHEMIPVTKFTVADINFDYQEYINSSPSPKISILQYLHENGFDQG